MIKGQSLNVKFIMVNFNLSPSIKNLKDYSLNFKT